MALGHGIILLRGLVNATAKHGNIAFSVGWVCLSWKTCIYWLNYKWLFTQFTVRLRLGSTDPADFNCPKHASIPFGPVSEKESSSLKLEDGPELFKVTSKTVYILLCLIPHSFFFFFRSYEWKAMIFHTQWSTHKEMRITCSAVITTTSLLELLSISRFVHIQCLQDRSVCSLKSQVSNISLLNQFWTLYLNSPCLPCWSHLLLNILA